MRHSWHNKSRAPWRGGPQRLPVLAAVVAGATVAATLAGCSAGEPSADRAASAAGIASLISWRGVWYVVHFGGVIRPEAGIVDDPEAGPGYTGPAGGC